MKLLLRERAAIQMMEMAIEFYSKENGKISPKEAAELIVEATKEMIRRGNLKDGMIVGDSEK